MKQQYEQVLEFMRAMNQETPRLREMPKYQTVHARFKMLDEEVFELRVADNYTDYVDAVVDILYVTLGAAVEAGLDGDTLAACFDEVHRANMSKFWTAEQVAEHKGDLQFEYSPAGYIAKRDGKVVKPPTFTPPNLSAIIHR